MSKVNIRNTRTRCEICLKLTVKTPERRQWRHSGVFIVNFEQVSADWETNYFQAGTQNDSDISVINTTYVCFTCDDYIKCDARWVNNTNRHIFIRLKASDQSVTY